MRSFIFLLAAPATALLGGTGSLRGGAGVLHPERPCRACRISAGFFDELFKESDEVRAEKDRAFEEQQEVLKRRRDPQAQAAYLREMEARREAESKNFEDKFGWQKGDDPLGEFKKRQAAGKVNPLGYEDEPKGGIPMPMASFGVGGEFGVGGKYDNGERFDLRLPYAEQGWVDEEEQAKGEQVGFFENLLSGGRLQREADERRRREQEGGE